MSDFFILHCMDIIVTDFTVLRKNRIVSLPTISLFYFLIVGVYGDTSIVTKRQFIIYIKTTIEGSERHSVCFRLRKRVLSKINKFIILQLRVRGHNETGVIF